MKTTGGGVTVVAEVTFDDLVQDHKTAAQTFFENHLKSELTQGQATQAESWYLNKAADDERYVASAVMSYIYNVDDTTRALQVAEVDFEPISAQDIADGNVQDVTITNNASTTIFEFDAKDNYNNQDITSALYSATQTTSSLKLYSEAEADNIDRIFNIVKVSDSAISITNVNVTKGDESKDTLLKNLTNRAEYAYRNTSTTSLAGVKINESAYALENLGGSEIDEPTTPSDPGEETTEPTEPATAAEIIQALDENCKSGVLNAFDPFGVNENYVKDGQWFITQNEDGQITKAEYFFKYQTSETNAYYVISSVEFSSPVDIKNISNEDIDNANYTECFCTHYFNPNPTIQEEKADFANAMSDKIFGEKTGATRFFVNASYSVDSILKSEAYVFHLIEISNNEIKEVEISIKYSSNNDEYLAKLDDQSNYRIVASSEYNISGEKLETQTNETETTAAD